jgi:hypothetical protein
MTPTGLGTNLALMRHMQRRTRGFVVSRGQLTLTVASVVALLTVGGWWLGSRADGHAAATAHSQAEQLLTAASAWKREHSGGCPSVSQLKVDRLIERRAASDDPWGGRYRIMCQDNEVQVRSAGGDGRFRTDDDISLAADWKS